MMGMGPRRYNPTENSPCMTRGQPNARMKWAASV
jgi:hypothetical protein